MLKDNTIPRLPSTGPCGAVDGGTTDCIPAAPWDGVSSFRFQDHDLVKARDVGMEHLRMCLNSAAPGQDNLATGAGVNFEFTLRLRLLLACEGRFFWEEMQARFGGVQRS